MLVQLYVDDIIFGSTKKSLCTKFENLMHKKFQMSSMRELTFFLGLQVKQKDDGIFISQDKYVADILKKFDFSSVKTASTPLETNKALIKDEELRMWMFQVTPKTLHLHSVKRIFRYLKGQPKFGLWYHMDSPFDLEAFSDSDYARTSLDRKSITGGCQFIGKRLISLQCKKQTIVANLTTKAEDVTAANYREQVLWIQNQMLDYGFNFMKTKIYIDNESTICIMKNPVFHSKTKHIEIRHHYIRDCYENKLIQVIKIYTDHNVADLLTKAFDVSSTAELSLYCWMKLYRKVDAARIKENAEFHQIVDFLSTCSINYALIVSPIIYSSYIEQFWNTATSKTVNSVKQIHAIVDGNSWSSSGHISGEVILLLNDEDGIACLTNAEIFENLALMGYEQLFTKLTFQKGMDYSARFWEKPNEPPLTEGHTSRSREGSMEHTFELMDNVPPTPHDSPLTGGYTPRSDKGRLKLKELMAICLKLAKQVLDLEKKRDAQAVESSDDDSDAEDASKQGRESDKTKSMFQDSDFDVLDDDMEDVEGETVHTATAGVSAVSAPVTTHGCSY
ncbi:putative ribonuclease H-like domain-containing protein [Tanacetum coccineum]